MDALVTSVEGIAVIDADVSRARLVDAVSCNHDGNGTMFVVMVGAGELEVEGRVYPLPPLSYAVLPGAGVVRGGPGLAVLDRRHRGLFQVGGPVERTGRLRYIDGCSDTVLVSPAVRGDPCLNLLHVPLGVVQSDHEHPSVRVGIVLRGRGRCIAQGRPHDDLAPGVLFILEAGAVHRFETPNDDLLLVAWHPDSDTGPTDDDHPMLNRTLAPGGTSRLQP